MGRAISKHRSRYVSRDSDIEFQENIFDNNDIDSKSRIVYLVGEINEQSAAQVVTKLVGLAQISNRPIKFMINTYGGSIDESLAIYDAIKLSRAPVHTIGIGKIMSAGVLLLAAGEKGVRMIGPRSRVMIHNAWSGFAGDPFELDNEYSEFKRIAKLEESCLLAETKIGSRKLKELMNQRVDRYFTADEAIELGIADKLTQDR